MKLEIVVEPSGGIIVSLGQSVHFSRSHISRAREASMKLQEYVEDGAISKELHKDKWHYSYLPNSTMLHSSAWIFGFGSSLGL